MKSKILKGFVFFSITGFVLFFGGYLCAWKWMMSRHEVDKGFSLKITNKLGETTAVDMYADGNKKGVLKQMKGPGRHFINPITKDVEEVEDLVVNPGQIAVVKNNLGKDLPPGRFIAGPGEKGTLKKVLTPGTWRINSYGQQVEKTETAKVIKPGYVGVQTLREGENKGILDSVLTPGIYPINPKEIRVDETEIGYAVWVSSTEYKQSKITDPTSGETTNVLQPVDGTGIQFPLKDGKEMFLDITVIWGLFPEEAPRAIRDYGTNEMVVSKVIEPQVTSICKNLGSDFSTMDFIQSETRLKFQTKFTEELQTMGEDKGLHILVALVRRFGPDPAIKATIQETLLAEEERQTLAIEQQRDRKAAELEQSELMVDIAVADFDSETTKLVSAEMELGEKEAAEIKEEADRQVAKLANDTATIQAEIIEMLGQAEADVVEAGQLAEAKGYELKVQAYGDADTYNMATFAQQLPEDLSVRYQYAGEGTLWTDSEKMEELAAKKILEGKSASKKPAQKPEVDGPVSE
jgi:regulator of protease activity HflC (stomatin/prohibitin superfamily)